MDTCKTQKLTTNENCVWNIKEHLIMAADLGGRDGKCGGTKLELCPGQPL